MEFQRGIMGLVTDLLSYRPVDVREARTTSASPTTDHVEAWDTGLREIVDNARSEGVIVTDEMRQRVIDEIRAAHQAATQKW